MKIGTSLLLLNYIYSVDKLLSVVLNPSIVSDKAASFHWHSHALIRVYQKWSKTVIALVSASNRL